MTGANWRRAPIALRLSLLVSIVHCVMLVASELKLESLRFYAIALGPGSSLLGLIGAIELARRNPRAVLLVIAASLSVASYLLEPVIANVFSYELFEKFSVWEYWLIGLLHSVGWLLLARRPEWLAIALVVSIVEGLPPPLSSFLRDALRLTEHPILWAAWTGAPWLLGSVARLFILVDVPVTRPHAPRPSTSEHYIAMALTLAAAGIAVCALAFGPSTYLATATALAVSGFAVVASLAHGPDGGDSWWFDATVVSTTAAIVVTSLSQVLVRADDNYMAVRMPHASFAIALCVLATPMLALLGVRDFAARRGADAGGRRVCMLALIAAGAASVFALTDAWGRTSLADAWPLPVASILVAFGAAAVATFVAARALADAGPLPTAKLITRVP